MTEVQAEEKKQDLVEKVTNDEENEEAPAKENGVEEKEEENEDESDDESSEEELGLLERPVEILDRKRDRKSTDRLALEKYSAPKTPKEELDFTKGTGKKFGEIAFIKHMLEKTNAEELKTMHRILFLKVAKVTMVKKNIRTFCGYPFDKDSSHYKRADGLLDKIVMPHLRFILGIMGLEKSGDKLAIKERLLEYLMNPTDMEKPIPGKKSKAEKKKPSKKKKSKSKKDSKSSEEANDVSSGDESDKDADADDEGKEKKKKAASPKKKTPKKKDTPKKTEKKKKTPKQPAIKLPVPKKKKDASPKKRKAEDDSEDDEPLVKKPKGEPTDAELKKVVSTILQGADLEQITMKTVVKQVYEKYPDFDLTPRKDFIKNTVKEIIS